MRSFLVLVTFVLAAGVARPARAATDRAEILIREGVELRKKGRNADALTRFQSAYDLAHTPRAAAQLGLCEAALERWVDADAHLTESLLSSDPWIDRNRSVLDSTSANVRNHLVTVQVGGGPAGAKVTINGEVVGRLPNVAPVRVLPGQINATASLAGHDDQRLTKGGSAGETLSFDFALRPAASAAAPASVASTTASTGDVHTGAIAPPPADERNEQASSGSWLRPAAFVSGGLAAAALAFGIVSHVQREGAASDFSKGTCDKRADGTIAGGAECEDAASRFDSAKTRMIIGYAAAGALAATGLTLWLLDGHSKPAESKVATCAPTFVGVGAACQFVF